VSKNQDVLVHHIQKLSNKTLRKDQNINLALLALKENPEDLELNIHLSETYFYIKDHENSLNYIEKYLSFGSLDYYKKLGALGVFLKCCIALNKIEYAFTELGKYYYEYKNEAAYVLLCADLLYFIDKKEALKMYIQYVKIRNKNGPHQSDIFRNTIHPEQMIGKISEEIAL
jgi:tetratricopeptide (TPR) repeat protein